MAADARSNTECKPLRLVGGRSVLPLVTFGVFVAGHALFVLRSILDGSVGDQAATRHGVLMYLLEILFVLFLAGASVVLWRWVTRRRAAKVAEADPHALVFVGNRSLVLDRALRQVMKSNPLSIPKVLPLGIVIVADQTGMKWWRGWGHPVVFFEATWDVMVDVEVVRIADGGRVCRGMALSSFSGEVLHELPIIVIGDGLSGIFSLEQEKLSAIASQLKIWMNSVHET
jgi:hypothetical protein